MNNLTTRKIVLGILMVLVLAFSVQGIADALTFGTTRTGHLQTVFPDETFDISFEVNLVGDQAKFSDIRAGNASDPGYDLAAEDTHYRDLDGDNYRDDGNQRDADTDNDGDIDAADAADPVEPWMSEDQAYYFNNEAIQIGVSGVSGVVIDRIGSYDFSNIPIITLEEDILRPDGTAKLQTGTITVTCFVPPASNAGTVTITVSDITLNRVSPPDSSPPFGIPNTDYPSTITAANIDTLDSFTVYVLQNVPATPPTITSVSGGIALRNQPTPITVTLTGGSSDWYPVELEVVNGPGTLSMTRTGAGNRSLSTFTNSSDTATVYLHPNSGTNTIRVWAAGTNPRASTAVEQTYFYKSVYLDANLQIGGPGGNGQRGVVNTRLDNPFVVKVIDGNDTGIPGQAVRFNATGAGAELFAHDDFRPESTSIMLVSSGTGGYNPIIIKTNASGEAKVFLKVGASTVADGYGVGATFMGQTQPFKATAIAATATTIRLSAVSALEQSVAIRTTLTDPLVIRVQDGRSNPVAGRKIRFRAGVGILSSRAESSVPTGFTNTVGDVVVEANARGEAWVDYTAGNSAKTVEVYVNALTTAAANTNRQAEENANTVTFTINVGGSTGQPSQPSQPGAATRTITIVPSSIDGEPGEEIDISISSSPSTVVILESGELDNADFSRLFGTTPFDVTIELPDEEDDYTFSATAPGFTTATATVTVEEEEVALGRLSIVAAGAPSNGQQIVRITVRDSDGALAVGAVSVTLRGTGIDRIVPTTNGLGATTIPVPNTVAVSADGYTRGTRTLTGTGQQQVAEEDEDEVEEEVVTVSEPDSVSIVGPSQRDGTANTVLDAALIVEVVDEDGDAVADARVIFRVRTGQGRLSERGNGRAIAVQTNSSGHARATYTPISASSTVEAEARGVTRRVTFTITASGGSAGPVSRDVDGTPSGDISPVVHVGAAQRPPMLWVDGGAIYALVGASPQRFAPGVDNALNIAVAGGKVYWTEKTGESGGTINSANLNGSDVTELASIFATPMGIAVDVTNSKLYWTNSAGRIQSANLNGSGIKNVIPGGLESPMDLALAGGNGYWTQGNGSVRVGNLTSRVTRDISTGTDTPGSIVIGGNKVYWTEMTGDSSGTIKSANLNGTDVKELTSIRAVPMGIAVDGSRSKLYWTNSRGRIQSANLDGSGIKNVVDGLGSPGELVLSNSIAAPAGAGSSAGSGTTASDSKYDVNGDGTVDLKDRNAVAVASLTDSPDAKYDVNGDGAVDAFDLIEIIENLTPGAAGAPTLFGMKLTVAQIDRLQEQIDLLVAANDRSPAAMRTLVYLQQLLVTARPEKTQLLANYPNPFNPETWIPYELATDTNVRLTIYNTQGVVIRSLQFGHQSAGYYTGRDRAAYWDGRNALGEQVASGLYFYQLETDEMSSMRKMVILK